MIKGNNLHARIIDALESRSSVERTILIIVAAVIWFFSIAVHSIVGLAILVVATVVWLFMDPAKPMRLVLPIFFLVTAVTWYGTGLIRGDYSIPAWAIPNLF